MQTAGKRHSKGCTNETQRVSITDPGNNGTKVYHLSGPLFFGSVQSFKSLFDPRNDPEQVMIDFADSRVWDHSGLEAIDALAERYTRHGKRLRLRHLSPECRALLEKAGDLVEVDLEPDPRYFVADDRLA